MKRKSKSSPAIDKTFKPTVIICLILLSLCLLSTRRRNEVWRTEISLWEDVISKSPHKVRGWDALVVAYSKDGDYPNVIRTASRGLELFPKEFFLMTALANAYLSIGLVDKAIDISQQSVTVRPDSMNCYNLASLYLRAHSLDKAADAIRCSLKADPENVFALDSFIDIQTERHEWRSIIAELSTLDSDFPVPYAKAKICMNNEEYGCADSGFSALRNPDSRTIDIHDSVTSLFFFNRGLVKDRLNDLTGAIEMYEQSVRTDPILVQPNFNLAVDYLHVNRMSEGVNELRVVRNLDPANADAARILQALGQK